MRSDCMAAEPRFLCSYAWKVPPVRPAIFERAGKLESRGRQADESGAPATGHLSIPWKAYLASREFQHLASDLAEAFFSEEPARTVPATGRPAGLKAYPLPAGGAGPLQRLLAPVLADSADGASDRTGQSPRSGGLAAAA